MADIDVATIIAKVAVAVKIMQLASAIKSSLVDYLRQPCSVVAVVFDSLIALQRCFP